MKIMDFLNKKAVIANLRSTDKEGVIKELVESLVKAAEIKNREEMMKAILAREALGSTGIGQGIGIPHAKSPNVKELVAAFGLSQKGVNFDSLDGEAVYIFFLLIAPEESAGPHLKALARISRMLKDKYFREQLKKSKDEREILRIIQEEDAKEALR
ncbi:MAG: PTS fructose transporter subunit IIA [Omnitrophica bacterium RIFCSPLOWO2_01_FULL_45_10]|nr:MAG: PTS fructose transporter subunit IIA [Omnitrophica bacterium RIFCSPLOWO2_01_FULL_45_10]